MLFAFPAAIAAPIIAGILLGGPAVGFLVAGLAAVVIVGVAIRMEPRRSSRTAANDADEGQWRRSAARRFLVPLAIAAVGIVLIAMASETVRIIGWGTLGVAITVAISLVFLEVGYSEDRARAHDERARSGGRESRRLQ